MAKPFNRAQSLQNQQFLRELRRTGNVRLAAVAVGLKYSTIYLRRRRHPAFATRWNAAIAFAQARLSAEGRQAPKASDGGLLTVGGEPVIVRRSDGKLQMRTAHPGNLTKQSEQAFLSALSATANVRLSAAAAGAAVGAFYRRKHIDAAFAREWRLALAAGYEALETALLASSLPGSYEDDAWRHNDPPPIPPMTANQALQLLYLHQKEARLWTEPDYIKRRKGESREAHSFRLSAMYEARLQQEREKFDVAEAMRRAAGAGPWFGPKEPPPLPDLAQVTGWSKADPAKTPHNPDAALFGGWRLGNSKKD